MKALDLELLNLQDKLRYTNLEGVERLRCAIRRKWLFPTPEEVVRQLLLIYLTEKAGYSKNTLSVEQSLKVNGLERRADIIVTDKDGQPWLLIECKAPYIKLDQTTFDQAARYNRTLKVPFLLVCNGQDAYCCKVDLENERYENLSQLPTYPVI